MREQGRKAWMKRGRQRGSKKHAMNTTTTTPKNNKYKTHNNQTIEILQIITIHKDGD